MSIFIIDIKFIDIITYIIYNTYNIIKKNMESSTNIPLSVDWQNSKNKVWNLRAYIVTAVMALAAPGCTTTMPTYNACSDSVYISFFSCYKYRSE